MYIYIFLYAEKVPLCCARHPIDTTVPGDTPSPVLKKTNRCFLCCFYAVFVCFYAVFVCFYAVFVCFYAVFVCLGVENAPQIPKKIFPTDYAFFSNSSTKQEKQKKNSAFSIDIPC